MEGSGLNFNLPNNNALSNLEFGRMQNNDAVGSLEFNNMGGSVVSGKEAPVVLDVQHVRLRDGSIGRLVTYSNGKRLIIR